MSVTCNWLGAEPVKSRLTRSAGVGLWCDGSFSMAQTIVDTAPGSRCRRYGPQQLTSQGLGMESLAKALTNTHSQPNGKVLRRLLEPELHALLSLVSIAGVAWSAPRSSGSVERRRRLVSAGAQKSAPGSAESD